MTADHDLELGFEQLPRPVIVGNGECAVVSGTMEIADSLVGSREA